jgi:hypothetical protein
VTHQASQSAEVVSTSRGADDETVLNALVVSQSAGKQRVLTAVRRPATNLRHPGVVSLPTMRIPAAMGALLSGLPAGSAGPERPSGSAGSAGNFAFLTVHGARQAFGAPGVGRGLVSYLTEALLSRKLGAADLLETGRLAGGCAIGMVARAFVDDPTGTTESEPTLMHTVLVRVTRGAHLLPSASAAYNEICWVDPALLLLAWRCRDAQMLFPQANPFEICIRGLCIRSGVRLLEAGGVFDSDGVPDPVGDGLNGETARP